jgi:hypothetical protein
MAIVQIVGQLPPAISGVGDYACRLREAIAKATNGTLQSPLIACGATHQPQVTEPQAVNLTGRCSAPDLVEAIRDLAPDAVLLNYVGYAYAKRGAPFWLLRAMETLRERSPRVKLLTMFHELYANGMPWQSSFWLSPAQRYVAARLAELSDGLAVTSAPGLMWLARHRSLDQGSSACLPVCSNVGEPALCPAFESRERVAVTFNGGGPLRKVLQRRNSEILFSLREAGIHRVLQVGAHGGPFTSLDGVECVNTGPLDAAEIGRQLDRASVGFLAYWPRRVTKSGVMAAYLAHGLPAVLFDEAGACTLYPRERASIHASGKLTASVFDHHELLRASAHGYEWYGRNAHSHVHARHWLSIL